MPQTSYLLDMLKAVYTTNSDPSTMGRDLNNGLREKEKDLAKITHENLAASIPNYEELELKIASTMGSKITEMMLGLISMDDLVLVPPTMVFSNFSPLGEYTSSSSSSPSDKFIYAGTQYILDAFISGGSLDLSTYTYNWIVNVAPEHSNITFTEYSSVVSPSAWDLATIIEFSDPGLYAIQLQLTHIAYSGLVVILNTTATVL